MSSTQFEPSIPSQASTEPAPPPQAEPVVAAGLPPLASGVPTTVFGFAVVITMLSLSNSGIVDSAALFIPSAILLGLVMIGIGGLYEIRNGDLFGGTFGIAFAGFLVATGVTLRFFGPAADATPRVADAFGDALGSWFLLWALIAAFFAVAARLVNVAAMAAFVLLTVVLVLAGLANIIGGDSADNLTKAAGWAGLADGAAAFWLAGGLMLNTMYGRNLLPLGAPRA